MIPTPPATRGPRLRVLALLAAALLGGHATAQLAPQLSYEIAGPQQEGMFGHCVHGLGDLDKDGTPDFAVTGLQEEAPGQSRYFNAGSVHVYSGATGQELAVVYGEQLHGQYGRYTAGVGDFNGDGYPDLAVGAATESWPDLRSGFHCGAVYLISGAWILHRAGPKYLGPDPARPYLARGEGPNSKLGRSIAGMGDLDDDGYADLIVGAYEPHGAGPGYALAIFGPDGSRSRKLTVGNAPWAFFGVSVANAGDVDGNGEDDVLIGAFGANGAAGWQTGRAYLLSGESIADPGAPVQVLGVEEGRNAQDQFGRYVAGAGDLDGDGTPDLLVGAHFQDADGAGLRDNRGAVWIFSGAHFGAGAPLRQVHVEGGAGGAHFGNALSGCGDLDGDGVGEFLASGSYGNYTRVYSGGTGALLDTLTGGVGEQPLFGHSVRYLGRDLAGRAWIVLGAYQDALAGPDRGRVWVAAY